MTLLLVDAASLYFRAYFGIPEKAALAPDGSPVNAVRGFMDMVAQLVRTRRPDRLVCCLDADWRPAWRVKLLPAYKAQRLTGAGGELVPDGLVPQVPIIEEVLDAVGIRAVGVKNYEADDVIGALAAREPGPVEVATGDRDLFQVIDDARGVRVLYCGRGVAKLEVLDDAALQAKYGVPASGYADFAALRGDPSDGLPGVAGVGEKTAARLITRHGDLDGLLAALDDPAAGFAPGLKGKLVAGREYLVKAQKVVKVAVDAPVPAIDCTMPRVPADAERLFALAEKWGLASPARRLVDALAHAE
ncbi:5'-3' exonuclease [Virgisporangium aurantiacum]|uniref:5'-3' exonuclease n=1 Tax=Virgisporangium aurantiacum TaxID=175570 RepID=A0A8J3Z231_9ACTN|nr:5'-3' exonuclease [Virgisporangium aurantiacum]GIJ54967.1 5'-3' exonuclease [Virgisporangium aurantiacum]